MRAKLLSVSWFILAAMDLIIKRERSMDNGQLMDVQLDFQFPLQLLLVSTVPTEKSDPPSAAAVAAAAINP